MANVIDVSASGKPDAAVLTSTAKSGMLGGTYLHSKPLAAYLGETEVPNYVVRNKNSGLRIESRGKADATSETVDEDATADDAVEDVVDGGSAVDASEHADTDTPAHFEPATDFQALAAVTDVRIVFVVGTDEGDRSASIPLSDVSNVSGDSGLLGGELVITTVRDDRYVFPCRGNLDTIAEYVDRGAQAWTRSYSLLDDARANLRSAERHREAESFAKAIDDVDDAVEAVENANERIDTFGEGAANSFGPEIEELRRTLDDRRREIHTEHAVHAHERARRHWGNRNYEGAHQSFLEARSALNRAQELAETEGITDRLERIDDELDDLADAPLSYASAMVEEAKDSNDVQTTAQCWEVAIGRYRDVYALDWGREDERFRGDPDEIRDHVLDAVAELVDHRIDVIDAQLDEAEWFRQSDEIEAAREMVEEAIEILDRTEELANELTHEEYPELDRVRRDVEVDHGLLSDA